MYKNISVIIFSLLLALAEISMIWSLPYPANQISLVIPLLIFLIMFERKGVVWLSIFVYGLILDIFTFLPLGSNIFILVILYFLGRFLFYNYFSNPSFLTSVILSAALALPFKIFKHIIGVFESDGGLPMFFNGQEWRNIGLALVMNLLAITIIYIGYKIAVKIIKPRGLLYGKI